MRNIIAIIIIIANIMIIAGTIITINENIKLKKEIKSITIKANKLNQENEEMWEYREYICGYNVESEI